MGVRTTGKEDADSSKVLPANLYCEGHEQHSRWFLTSLVSSVALNGSTPFRVLKTHGSCLNEDGDKLSKASGEHLDPADFIDGTVKLSGERSHGFGIDSIRAWAVGNDSDRNFFCERDDLNKVGSE